MKQDLKALRRRAKALNRELYEVKVTVSLVIHTYVVASSVEQAEGLSHFSTDWGVLSPDQSICEAFLRAVSYAGNEALDVVCVQGDDNE